MGNSGRVRSNAWIWDRALVHAQDQRPIRPCGFRYSPTTSLTFSMKQGSDALRAVGLQSEGPPDALTVLWLSPLPLDRVLQWVASRGAVSSAQRNHTHLHVVIGTARRPSAARLAVRQSSSLRSRNRERHFPTVSSGSQVGAHRGIAAAFGTAQSIILARSAKACAVFGRQQTVPRFHLLHVSPEQAVRQALVVRLPWLLLWALTRRIPHRLRPH